MRGFGAVQVCFAHEAQMDRLARALGTDALELRLKNAVHPTAVLPTGQTIRGQAPVRELIRRCAALPLPNHDRPEGRPTIPGAAGIEPGGKAQRRGVGFAAGYKNLAYSEGFDDSSAARIVLRVARKQPIVEVHTAAAEVGQGIYTVLAQVARTELGDVRVIVLSNTGVGSAGSSSASRQSVMSGGAVQTACAAVRAALFARVKRDLPQFRAPASLRIDGGDLLLAGRPIGPVGRWLETPIDATRVYRHARTTPLSSSGQGEPHVAFAFAVARAVVDVDRDLGTVRVVDLAVCQDVGRAIHPQQVCAQIEGGVAQGLGLALMEEIHLEAGRIRNGSFTDYLIPTILDMPSVTAVLVERPEPGMPYGAKGVGEPPSIVSTAAIAAALRDATGLALNRVPIRPDDLTGLATPWQRDPLLGWANGAAPAVGTHSRTAQEAR